MNKNILIWTLIVAMCLLPIGTAFELAQETTSVSRIVGESPGEMLKQLQRDEITLNHATYYSNDLWFNQKDDILEEQFREEPAGNLQGVDWYDYEYTFDDVTADVHNFESNELFILETTGATEELRANATYEEFYPKDLRAWQDDFRRTNPLFLFDSPYAGAYLPKKDSFVARTVRDATIIAPTSFHSSDFTKSFLCKLVDEKSIGDVFKDARNFHFNGGSHSDGDNLIGLVLQSYTLYGNPRQKINMDWSESDLARIKDFCKNNLENSAPGIEYIGQIDNQSVFRKHITFKVDSHGLINVSNYTLINATPAFQEFTPGELILPKAVRTTEFPLNTIILNYSLDSVGNAVQINAENLPSYFEGITPRICYSENENASIDFDMQYAESSQNFIAIIKPVEILNCTSGIFKLYREFNYSVDYISFSPVIVSHLNHPYSVYANEIINVSMNLSHITTNVTPINVQIKNTADSIIWESETYSNQTNLTAEFYAAANEGLQQFSVHIVVNDTSVAIYPFTVFVTVLEPLEDIPQSIGENPTITFNFNSHLPTAYSLRADYYLERNHTIITQGSFAKTINPGNNNQQLSFTGLTKSDQSYILRLELEYLDQSRTISYLLTTNNPPIIYSPYTIHAKENDSIIIPFSITDVDNDSISVNINDTRFTRIGDTYVWQTSFSDDGDYAVKITANDDYLQTAKEILINIDNIVYCNDVITTSNSLDRNILCTEGITIIGNNATFNCKGYIIEGTGSGNGIRILNSQNITVTDCNIRNFENGIRLENTNNSDLYTNTLTENQQGIHIASGTQNTIIYNTLFNNALNAYELSTGNYWNLSSTGNSWDDFPENPGFPDHYEIPGPGDGIDYHPLYDHFSCGDILTTDLLLPFDLNCEGDAIIVGEPDITIDCQNHSITGPGMGIGITLTTDNVTVKNCRIENFTQAIRLSGSSNTITQNVIQGNIAQGIFVENLGSQEFFAGWDDGDYSHWENGSGIMHIVSCTGMNCPAGSTKTVKDTSLYSITTKYNLPQTYTDILNMTFWIRADENSAYFTINQMGAGFPIYLQYFRYSEGYQPEVWRVGAYNGDPWFTRPIVCAQPLGTWKKMSLIINLTSQTFDAYCSDVQTVNDRGFTQPLTNITHIGLSGSGVGLYLDNLTLSEGGIPPRADNLIWANQFIANGINAYEEDTVQGNNWDNSIIGNNWDDFPENPGFPDQYEIPGPGDGIDYHPIHDPINQPPELDPLQDHDLHPGQTLAIQLNATDPDNDTLTYGTDAYEYLPYVLFNTTTGYFEWTPQESHVGHYTITFWADDDLLRDYETTHINVTALENTPPTHSNPILSSELGTNTSGEDLYCMNQSTYDAEGDPVENIINWEVDGTSIFDVLYPFSIDESSVSDYSGNNHIGTLNNNPSWSDGAYTFTYLPGEAKQYIELNNIHLNEEHTLCVGFTPLSNPPSDDYQNVSNIFHWEGHNWSVNRIDVEVGKDYDLTVEMYDNTGGLTNDWFSSNNIVSPNAINHYCYVFKNGVSLRNFVNGQFKQQTSLLSKWYNFSDVNRIRLGRGGASRNNITEYYFYLFNRALSDEEVIHIQTGEINKLASQDTHAGETWTCEITPTDGKSDGLTKTSNPLVILPADLCGITLYQNTSLTDDISDCLETAVVIGADHVWLNCNNYMISTIADETFSDTGISATGKYGIRIESCRINSSIGIDFSTINHSDIYNNEIFARTTGVRATQSTLTSLMGNQITSETGIILQDSFQNLLMSNTLTSQNLGLWLRGDSIGNYIFFNHFLESSAKEEIGSYGNIWNYSDGNYWSDFDTNPGFPWTYTVSGPGDGIDYSPIGRCKDGDGDTYSPNTNHNCPHQDLDCNDNDPTIHPGQPENCNNDIDDNCNGQINEGCGGGGSPLVFKTLPVTRADIEGGGRTN